MKQAPRPFLKWAGGKLRIRDRICALLPPGSRLIEPFVGSAAVWLGTNFPSALLADKNADLINVYQVLQEEGPDFIEYCRQFFCPETNTRECYNELRDRFNHTTDRRERAALFIYLNRHGFNGLCRFNSLGMFNVPFGRYRRPYFPAAEMLAFFKKAQTATFMVADFRTVLKMARKGDVVYCDPPYVPLSSTANFTKYTGDGFSRKDQEDLLDWAERLARKGIPVIISNHATPWTRSRYSRAVIQEFLAPRVISCNGNSRGSVREILAVFGGRS
jgi:DNA adenine methylase